MNENHQPAPGAQLKALLKEAGIRSTRLDATKRLAMLSGRTRDWTYTFNIYNGWLHVTTYVCEVPELDGLRAMLLDVAMAANQTMSLTKLVKGGALYLELEYRIEHVDATVLNNLMSLMHSNAEEYSPRLFRVVTGDAVLDALTNWGRPSEVA